jgi:outer membrane lipoprotein-sorting protein
MKKFLLIPFSVFLLTGTLSANVSLKSYLKEIQKMKSFSADFKQVKRISVMDLAQKSKGYVRFKRVEGKKHLIWAMTHPYSNKFILIDDKIIKENEFLGEREETNLESNPQIKMIFENIFIIFGMTDQKEISDLYKIETHGNKISLIPKKESFKRYLEKIELKIHGNIIDYVKIFEKGKDYTEIYFQNIQINTNIPDSEFQ